MTLSLAVINLSQHHMLRHQGCAALDTVLLFVSGTLEIFLCCHHPWSSDMKRKVSNCLFPSDIQHFLSNLQFGKCILVNCLMSADIRSISTATQ